MKEKELIYGSSARNKIRRGIQSLSGAVKVTLGPKGRNVVIEDNYGRPVMTKDGVSVAMQVKLFDPIEDKGAQMVKQVAMQTAEEAGDGTTTATILAEKIYESGLKFIENGSNPTSIKHGIDCATEDIVAKLKENAKLVDSIEEIAQIGIISANGDVEVGNLLSKAMDRVGKTGTITVDRSNGIDTTVEFVEGMEIDRGYLSPYFATNPDTLEAVLENPYILLLEQKLTAIQDVLPILQKVAKSNRPLLIMAEEVDGEALATLVLNHMKGQLKVCAIKSPGFGNIRSETMRDIAVLTGGTYITEDLGIKPDGIGLEHLGQANKITVGKNKTTILDGLGEKEAIESRCKTIMSEIEGGGSDYEQKKAKERLGKLKGGVAVIKVGAPTELELKEKMDRVDDALHATKAAAEEGIVPGGGLALLNASELVKNKFDISTDEFIGYKIVVDACKEPLRQLADNAGMNPDLTVAEVMKMKNGVSYNFFTGKTTELITSGIIDPVKVTRLALTTGASISGLLLTTECIVSSVKETDAEKQGKAIANALQQGAGMM